MRTNIEIDDRLMTEAQKLSGLATKKQTVEEALRFFEEKALVVRHAVADGVHVVSEDDLHFGSLRKLGRERSATDPR